MTTPRAFVAGCAGLSLSADEIAFFRDADPLGFILFRRNIADPDQVRALTSALRQAVGREDAPVFVDQEGGRVQRLGPPHWPKYPSGRTYARVGGDIEARCALVRTGARLIAHDLRAVGISVDCLPVLDVPVPGAHDVIGDRAYDTDPQAVAALGRAAAEGLMEAGVLPVIKHIPGHGRAGADSHLALPRVSAPLTELRAHDFPPFRALADMPIGMTAHVVYEAIDPERPATTSPVVISEIIRREIGFGGLLLTDDLSMKAMSGTFRERAEAALRAGCDIALHCNGNLDEARQVAEAVPGLAGESARRVRAAQSRISGSPIGFDVVDARRRLEAALADAA
jgi:beta-N-acetylhexosaminidase